MHSTESRCVKGPENTMFAGMPMHLSASIFFFFLFLQAGGCEGVNLAAAAKLQYKKKEINSLLEMSTCCKKNANK